MSTSDSATRICSARSIFDELGRFGRLLRDDRQLVRFIAARALLMCSALSAPFLVLLAQGGSGAATTDAAALGAFLLASALAASVSILATTGFSSRNQIVHDEIGPPLFDPACLIFPAAMPQDKDRVTLFGLAVVVRWYIHIGSPPAGAGAGNATSYWNNPRNRTLRDGGCG